MVVLPLSRWRTNAVNAYGCSPSLLSSANVLVQYVYQPQSDSHFTCIDGET